MWIVNQDVRVNRWTDGYERKLIKHNIVGLRGQGFKRERKKLFILVKRREKMKILGQIAKNKEQFSKKEIKKRCCMHP